MSNLLDSGLSSVLVYQETYNREAYAKYHLKGMKRDFDYRLETPERLGRAGLKKIGLGALYGLMTGARIRLCSRVTWLYGTPLLAVPV